MSSKKSTPWGPAVLVDEVVVEQQAGDRAFATHVQLLETAAGERLVRLAYATAAHGWVRRGPVTMQIGDLERLRETLAEHPELETAFGYNGAATRGRRGARGLRRRASPG
jgi:hypothetical protein